MKKSLLLFSLLVGSLVGRAQAPINYEFEILEFVQHSCQDGSGSDNESTWKLWYKDNTMGTTWHLGDCHFTDNTLPNIYQPVVQGAALGTYYERQTNTTASLLDIRIDFWEDDCDGGTGADRCSFSSSCLAGLQEDDDRQNHNPYIGSGGSHPSINMRDSSYCEWHIGEYSVGCFSFKFRFKWEYSTIDAGTATAVGCDDSLQLAGFGSGQWSILSGGTGGFLDAQDPNTIFHGNTGGMYTLSFDYLPGCYSSQFGTNDVLDVTMVSSINPQLQLTNAPCIGSDQEFDVADGGTYYWAEGSLSNHIDTTTANEFTYSPSGSNVDIYVTVVTPEGCISYDSLNYNLLAGPVVDLGNDTTICPGTSLGLDATNQSGGLTQYLWNTGGQSSQETVSSAGIYYCTLTNLDGCESRDSIEISLHPVSPLDLGGDVEFCIGDTVVLDAGSQFTFDTYAWSDASGNPTLEVTQFGEYSVIATDANNCEFYDTVTFSPEYTYFELYEDTTIYIGMIIDLIAENGVSYSWNTGENTQTITVSPQNDTLYEVVIEQTNGCFRVGTVNVFIDESIIVFVPNMFSPNMDGSNDEFLVYGNGIETIHFKIYNRWGDMIYETTDVNEMQTTGWDGMANGEEQPAGTYVWTLEGTDIYGNTISFNGSNKGTVLLRR
ncbi:MAG: gliding motility-associated C-terminal domain-containing protein [Flavobacteriales bacterium]|nr:gliding motility-associated C-terminal domain-containing protein [Flavobacteriales bacterium]